MAAAQVAFDPKQSSNLNDQTPQFRPGTEYEDPSDGKVYIYVRHHQGVGAVASANGAAAFWRTYSSGSVTPDKTDNEFGAAIPAGCAGIYGGVVTHLYYTWLQKRGEKVGVILDADGAIGNWVGVHAQDLNTSKTLTLANAAVAATAVNAAPLVGIQKTAPGGAVGTVLLMIS